MITNIPTHYLQKAVILLVILALIQLGIGQAYAKGTQTFNPKHSKELAVDYAKSATESFVWLTSDHEAMADRLIIK